MATQLFNGDGLYVGPEEESYPSCPTCGADLDWEYCDNCEDGYSHHDCGEDTCCCLHPEDNVKCSMCDGYGGWYRCWEKHDGKKDWTPSELPKGEG